MPNIARDVLEVLYPIITAHTFVVAELFCGALYQFVNDVVF